MTKDRINWIDWAKCIAITMVVYGHTPQLKDSFLPYYVCLFHIPFFYFISGYLTKARFDTKEEFNKCKKSLIIPYFLYNIIFYPYWAVRLYLDEGVNFSFSEYIIKPIIGLLFLQIDTPISYSVNGAMWFIVVLFVMRFTIHICIHTSKPLLYMKTIAIVLAGIYFLAIYKKIPFPLTIDGIFRCMPLYILGYLTRYYHWLDKVSLRRSLIMALILISISLWAAYITKNINSFTYERIAFCIVLISAPYGFLFLCKVLNNITSPIIVNISIGTLMIMGLHWMFIGTTNFVLEHILSMNTGITYSGIVAIIFAIGIDAAVYPLIIFAKKYMPILLGK